MPWRLLAPPGNSWLPGGTTHPAAWCWTSACRNLSGLDLQEQLLRAEYSMPIIFVTGHGDVPMTVQGMKRGAIDFLLKPVEREKLLEAIRQALEKDRAARSERDKATELQQRLQLLTTREREVMSFVIAGLLNKQIASELGITEATVKAHRGNLMEKLTSDLSCRIGGFCPAGRSAAAKPAGQQSRTVASPLSPCPWQLFD